MYIVNKSQNNKKSFLKIVTPTANIGARGTQGYVAASDERTLLANQAGAVGVKSSDPNIDTQVNVGPMMKTVVRAGVAPIPPRPLSANELSTFRSFVVGDLAFSGVSENALISVEEITEKEKEEKEELLVRLVRMPQYEHLFQIHYSKWKLLVWIEAEAPYLIGQSP